MPAMLAVAYGGGHINALLPVILDRRAAGWRVEILALTTAAATCAAGGVPFSRLMDIPDLLSAEARRRGAELAATLPANPAVPVEESIAYLGAGWGDLAGEFGALEADRRYAAEGRRCFLPVAALERAIRHFAPDLVLTTSAPRAERAAVLAAGRLGIPSICVVDLFAIEESAWIGQPGYASRVCVPVPGVRQRLLDQGRHPDEIVVTGNPAFDRLGDPTLGERGQRLRERRGWLNKKLILWASQPEPQDPAVPRGVESALVAALGDHPDWQLVIRPHPNDQYTLPLEGPQVCHSFRGENLAELLAACDLVVTMTSTVGLEAVLLGKPLVTWDRSASTWGAPYAEMGLSLGVVRHQDLAPAVARALAGGGPRPQLPPVGGGTARVSAVASALLG